MKERLNRREMLLGLGSVVGALSVSHAFADSKKDKKVATSTSLGAHPYQKAIDAAAECAKKGDICIAHCQQLLSKGDTSLAACLQTALSMSVMCAAFAKVAAYEPKSLKKVAIACADLCRECEKACHEHESHHVICKECAESCTACARECDAVA
jgi:Cys-rich four helix bundle protein (predicted Tat secretion target)